MKRIIISAISCIAAVILFSCGGGSSSDSGGDSGWTKLWGVASASAYGTDIAVDSSGNSFMVGTTSGTTETAFVIKYNSAGAKQWEKLLAGTGTVTYGKGIAVDAGGNIYVTGYSDSGLNGESLTGTYDAFIVKYNSEGVIQWTKLLGVSGKRTQGNGIGVDSTGYIYVAGYTGGNLGGETLTGYDDLFITKYDTDGSSKWIKLLGRPACDSSICVMTVDSNGNSYVAGPVCDGFNGQTVTGNEDAFVVMYDTNGNNKWTTFLGASAASTESNGIAVDASGSNIYLTGYTTGSLDGITSVGDEESYSYVTKYEVSDTAADKKWTKMFGVAGADTMGKDIAADPDSNIYVTGSTSGNLDGQTLTGERDVFVIKYDTDGNKKWTKLRGVAGSGVKISGTNSAVRASGPETGVWTGGTGIAVDSSGISYVSGNTEGNLDGETLTGARDVFVTTKFND